MMIEFERIEKTGNVANVYEDAGIVLGISEHGFDFNNLAAWFPVEQIVELKQVHSNIIRFAGEIEVGSEGDGIILEQRNRMAVIKTADCVPLFFWCKEHSIKNPLPGRGASKGRGGLAAGIVHVGWQGLQKGIEKKLLELLAKKQVPFEDLHFFMGPAIEKNCYEVGRDLYEKFSGKEYRDEIFIKKNREKYLMDVKRGIFLSLKGAGIRDDQIEQTDLCTYCEKERFPSYRRDKKTGRRIYNFLYLKPV